MSIWSARVTICTRWTASVQAAPPGEWMERQCWSPGRSRDHVRLWSAPPGAWLARGCGTGRSWWQWRRTLWCLAFYNTQGIILRTLKNGNENLIWHYPLVTWPVRLLPFWERGTVRTQHALKSFIPFSIKCTCMYSVIHYVFIIYMARDCFFWATTGCRQNAIL